jgi:alkanesulfonate monooxygenase SsuD/methylene tetrahydromethanopterin reductase-like flavin-dependent oxidoreductase (luciferase family)
MRVGVVILPEHPWPTAAGLWRQVEEMGFAHAWTYDHLSWRSMRDSPWFAAIPTLTAAACVTSRIRLGTLVASANFRHPVTFAKELMTLDDISGGRVTLGIGAGGSGHDATVLGQEPWSTRERAERFAEFLGLLDRLLREPVTTAHGEYYAADDARMIPGCIQRPRLPFAVAGTGPRGMALAARFGETWVTDGNARDQGNGTAAECFEAVRLQVERLDQVCANQGRDPSSLRRMALFGFNAERPLASVEAFSDVVGRYGSIGITDIAVHYPRAEEPFRADLGILENVAALLDDHAQFVS